MTLSETIRSQINQAAKAKDIVRRDVLRVALGEIETLGAKSGHKGPVSDEEAFKIIRKMVASNQEMIASYESRAQQATSDSVAIQDIIRKLRAEDVVLEALLPKTLSPAEIQLKLATVQPQIVAAKNDGVATGIAMKALKGQGEVVSGDDVKAVVASMRALVATA